MTEVEVEYEVKANRSFSFSSISWLKYYDIDIWRYIGSSIGT